MIRFVVTILMLLSLASSSVAMAEAERSRTELLNRALSQYAAALEESDRDRRLSIFSQAELGFQAVIGSGAENADLYTNLGNAALQAEHRGRAVLAFHRALRLDPDASTARQNLAHIRGLLPAWVPRPSSPERLELLFSYRRIPATSRSYLAAALFAVGTASLAISTRRREGPWRGLALVGMIAWALVLTSVGVDAAGIATADVAVITADEALARSADSRLAALALPDPLPAGVEVALLEERDEWTRVRLHNGRDVWVNGSSVTRVVQ